MCCCGQPIINGQMGYKWQPNDEPSVRPVHPPDLAEGDVLLYDEPGRCGRKLDSHCHHFRIVRNAGQLFLLVRHGGGDERMQLGWVQAHGPIFEALSSDDRYWLCQAIHHSTRTAAREAEGKANATWQLAAAEKRIKARKQRGRASYKVWIEPRVQRV